MTKPLSNDLRERLIEAVAAGMSRRAAADRFGVAASTAVKWARRWRETGAGAAASGWRQAPERIEAQARRSLGWSPRRTTSRCRRLPAIWSGSTASDCAKHGLAFPGSPRHDVQKTAHASEQERPDVAAQRQAWRATQAEVDPQRLVFIDETGASTKMARLCGRSLRGTRCLAAIPHGHWKTTTFVGGLRLGGMTAPTCSMVPWTGRRSWRGSSRCWLRRSSPATSS